MRVLTVQSKRTFFILKTIVYSLRIIGLAPFAVVVKKSDAVNPWDSQIKIFRVSRFGLAYNILLLIPLVAVAVNYYSPNSYFSIYSTMDEDPSSFNFVEYIIYGAECIFFIFSACVVVISWGFRQEEAASIMNRLFEIDVKLSTLKKQPSSKSGFMFLSVHAALNATLWIIFWVRKIVYFKMSSILPMIFIKIPDYIIYWFIIEYFVAVGLLARYIGMVNKNLRNFHEFGNFISRPMSRRNNVRISILVEPINRNDQLSSLQLLQTVRTTLYDLCGDISDFFSLPILFCITCCFIPLVRELYVVATFAVDNIDVSVAASVSYVFLIIFLYVYPVLSLALNVTKTGNQARLTGNIVHKLLASSMGQEIKSELTQFSLQLLHEDVKFTARGLFTLDSKLLLSMLGGAATYFVALMQFQSNCNCENTNSTTNATWEL